MSQIYDIESQSCHILNQLSEAKSKVTFPLSSQNNTSHLNFNLNLNASIENRLTFRNPQSQQNSNETYRSHKQSQSSQPKSSKVMSENGISGEPFYTISVLSETSGRDLETVVIENNYLRKKVGRMEAKLEKYREIIGTLVGLVNQ